MLDGWDIYIYTHVWYGLYIYICDYMYSVYIYIYIQILLDLVDGLNPSEKYESQLG